MVMYRDFTTRKARSLGLLGSVKNIEDGSVFVVAEGEEEDLKRFLVLLNKGPILSRVDDVKVLWMTPTEEFTDFKILYN